MREELLINFRLILEGQQRLLWGTLLSELLELDRGGSGVEAGGAEGGAKDGW